MRESRSQQDNEQWHLLILEELKNKSGIREHFFYRSFMPQAIDAPTLSLMRQLKSVFDPDGILNPGKLLPD